MALEAGELVLRRGECFAKFTIGLKRRGHMGYRWRLHPLPGPPVPGRYSEDRYEGKGELVLTNKRLVFLGTRGWMRKRVVPLLELDLKKISGVAEKPSPKGGWLVVSLDLGGMRPWVYEFRPADAAGWAEAVEGAIGRR